MTEEQIREEIARIVWADGSGVTTGFDGLSLGHPVFKIAAQILSIKVGNRTLSEWIELHDKGKLRVEAGDQELPEQNNKCRLWDLYQMGVKGSLVFIPDTEGK